MVNRREFLVLMGALALAGCTGPGPRDRDRDREKVTADEFSRRAGEIAGVKGVDTSGEDWLVDFDTALSAEDLKAMSDRLFELVNAVVLPTGTWVRFRSGKFRATLLQIGNGRPSFAPEMRWVRWLDGTEPFEEAAIDELLAKVTVSSDPLSWLRSFMTAVPAVDEYSRLRVEHDQTAFNLVPGRAGVVEDFEAIDRATTDAGAEWSEASLDHNSSVTVRVDDRDHAVATVDRLLTECPDPTRIEVTLAAANGDRWRGALDQIRSTVAAEGGLAAAVAATGANLSSSCHGHTIDVADADVLEKVIALLASPQWTPSPDRSVTINVKGNPNSNSGSPEVWAEAGPLLVDAIRSGFLLTRVTNGTGGQRKRCFDISFMQHSSLPDLTTPEGYQRIIDLMRRHTWQGEAQIELSYGDNLIFWSTDTGKAKDAYFASSSARSRRPQGWAKDFLKAWDATASR